MWNRLLACNGNRGFKVHEYGLPRQLTVKSQKLSNRSVMAAEGHPETDPPPAQRKSRCENINDPQSVLSARSSGDRSNWTGAMAAVRYSISCGRVIKDA
jgi:hypothetical protein